MNEQELKAKAKAFDILKLYFNDNISISKNCMRDTYEIDLEVECEHDTVRISREEFEVLLEAGL